MTKRLTNWKFKKILTKLAKYYAKHRDNYTCQKCWRKTNIHWSHIIPVSADGRLSINVDNIKALCYNCHFNFWHLNPSESWEWINKKRPERMDKLRGLHKEHSWMWSIKIWWYRDQAQEMIDLFKWIKIKKKHEKEINKLLKQLKKDLQN